MHKRIIIALGGAAMLAAPLMGIGAAQAAPAGHQVAMRDGTGLYCTAVTQTLCISANGNSGSDVFVRTPGNSAQFTTVGHYKCFTAGGTATDLVQDASVQGDGPSCPFTSGSGNNTRFEGHEIVWFTQSSQTVCMGADTDFDNPTMRSCQSTGVDWVRAKTADPYAYVNVHATNLGNTPVSLQGDGPAGTVATTGNLDTGDPFQLWSRQ